MKKVIILVVFTLGAITIFGQQTIFQTRNAHNVLYGSTAMNRDINLEKEVKGSQYFQENFMYAFVDDMDKPFKMRYNAFLDEMEFDHEGQIYDLDKDQYKVINFDDLNKKFVIAQYNDGRNTTKGYLVQLVGGENFSLYKREKMEFAEAQKTGTGFGIDTPATYKPKKDDFFVQIGEGGINPLPSSRSKITALFGDKSKEITKFIKENRISLSSEIDLKRVFQFANSL